MGGGDSSESLIRDLFGFDFLGMPPVPVSLSLSLSLSGTVAFAACFTRPFLLLSASWSALLRE